MIFQTTGNKSNLAILFFHAMGVNGVEQYAGAEKLAANSHRVER